MPRVPLLPPIFEAALLSLPRLCEFASATGRHLLTETVGSSAIDVASIPLGNKHDALLPSCRFISITARSERWVKPWLLPRAPHRIVVDRTYARFLFSFRIYSCSYPVHVCHVHVRVSIVYQEPPLNGRGGNGTYEALNYSILLMRRTGKEAPAPDWRIGRAENDTS